MTERKIYTWHSFARIGPFDGRTLYVIGFVSGGETTPWAWAKLLPGLGNREGSKYTVLRSVTISGRWRGWSVRSERRPEVTFTAAEVAAWHEDET